MFFVTGSNLEKAGGKEFRDEVDKLRQDKGSLETAGGELGIL